VCVGIVWLLYLFVFLLLPFHVLLLWLTFPRLLWIGAGRESTLVLFLTLEEIVTVFPH
jgi:hypothetical protein